MGAHLPEVGAPNAVASETRKPRGSECEGKLNLPTDRGRGTSAQQPLPPLPPHRTGGEKTKLATVVTTLACVALIPLLARADDSVVPARKPLVVCAVPGSMPRADKTPDGTPKGLDAALAIEIGRVLGRTVEFHWCASPECSWHCLPEKRCDVVLGQPLGSGPQREVAWSVPYAGAKFGLVVARDLSEVHSLGDLRGKKVGIVAGTVAISEKDHSVVRFKSRESLLEALEHKSVDVAFLDADFAAWYLHEHPKLSLRLVDEFIPRERWNLALAVRSADAQLLVDLNRTLAELAQSGALKKIYEAHGVPFRTPFTSESREPTAPSTWRRIQERGELVVAFDPANLPYSGAKDDRPGLDVELARALAAALHLKLRLEWIDVQHETAVGELLQGQCDLVFGDAVDENAVADDEALAGKILHSRPYYGTGYLILQRKNGPHATSLEDLKGAKSERLGTEAGSVADYSLRRRGYHRRLFRNQLATLKALNDGGIDFAYLWANVGWTLHASPDLALEIVPNYALADQWNIAVAMRRSDVELKQHVDDALGKLIADGVVVRTLARYHVPYYPPAHEPSREGRGSADGVIRHGVTDRGPEPQMQKVQASKKPYSALARIRSAGELVVGLDQNNLPFSTAHPKPAGLDYEIAGLLAERLGVSLRVYWAYSSHDSYPSKLASKQLCDVILGITPDDRFGRRVLYSQPYYSAEYEWVVRSGEGTPVDSDTIAVEEGLAVRGLEKRNLNEYPNTEAVLDAVSTGKVRAGYVISTRATWLAHERWPGKLTFHRAADRPDRFPISAAVRKADGDLKDAIDRAWDELDRSGRLAQVFARWHVPYDPRTHHDERR